METKNLSYVLGTWTSTALTFLLLGTGDALSASIGFSLGVTFMVIMSAISEE